MYLCRFVRRVPDLRPVLGITPFESNRDVTDFAHGKNTALLAANRDQQLPSVGIALAGAVLEIEARPSQKTEKLDYLRMISLGRLN